ncbi:class I SAM-dependent methyltransferase [Dactylosporangium vinaceum]
MHSPIFAGTAEYYAQYRPAYPSRMLTDLVELSVGTHGRRLVDLGCGTGEVALPLSAVFDTVTAIDIDPGMVALAERKAAERQIRNVAWTVGAAESLDLPAGSADLVVAGSSFHWMDRELLAGRVRAWLTGSGVFALLGGGSDVWEERAPWHTVAVQTIREYVGERRRAGNQSFVAAGRHDDYLERAGFVVESRQYNAEKDWTADEIVGYLYSTSYCNPMVLGDRKAAFEATLRDRLGALSAADTHPETLAFECMLARPKG